MKDIIGINKYNIKINFLWDDHDDTQVFTILIPSNITITEIEDILFKTHEYLDTEDESNIYGINGRNPATLLDYVCIQRDWMWEPFIFDIYINLD